MTAVYSSTAHPPTLSVRTIYDLFNEDRLEEALIFATRDVTIHNFGLGQEFKGRAGFLAYMQTLKKAFPDLRIEVVSEDSGDDRLVYDLTATGIHLGPLATPAGVMPPTGLRVHFTAREIWKLRGGKFYSLHTYQDATGILRQLGQL